MHHHISTVAFDWRETIAHVMSSIYFKNNNNRIIMERRKFHSKSINWIDRERNSNAQFLFNWSCSIRVFCRKVGNRLRMWPLAKRLPGPWHRMAIIVEQHSLRNDYGFGIIVSYKNARTLTKENNKQIENWIKKKNDERTNRRSGLLCGETIEKTTEARQSWNWIQIWSAKFVPFNIIVLLLFGILIIRGFIGIFAVCFRFPPSYALFEC